tara:strand:- start:3348 stop:3872 length:525 start_codon:yes stop_codon:yes gene_type:complete
MNYYDDLEKGYDKTILISNLVRNALVDKQLCELSRMFMRDHISIYILRLSNNKFYVGKTHNIFIRYKQHLNGNGSFWTKKYKPLYIDELIEDCDDYDEDKMVKIYMNKYGIDNVRGGTYIQEKLSNNAKRFITSELRMANNLCLCCGANDHFAKTCIYKSLYTYFITKIKNLFL